MTAGVLHTEASPDYLPVPGNGTVWMDGGDDHDPLLDKYRAFADEHQALLDQTIVDRAKEVSLNGAAAGAALADSPGAFELLWAGATVAAAQTNNTYLAAGLTTAAVLALEMGSAWGASRLLAKETGIRIVSSAHKLLGKLGVKEAVKTDLLTDSALTLAAGVPAMLTLKQALDPARTKKQNLRHGIKAGAIATAVGAPVNLAVAEGVTNVTPERVTVAGLAIAGLVVVASQAKKFVQRRMARTREALRDDEILQEVVAPRYDLGEEELNEVERRMVRAAKMANGRTLSAVWVRGDSHEANFLRTHEAQALPDANTPELFAKSDGSSSFLAIVDTRLGVKPRVIRGSRITGGQFAPQNANDGSDVENIATLRDMVTDGEISAEELQWYYSWLGIDLNQSVGVETNFRIGERARRRLGVIPVSQIAYLALYNYLVRNDPDSESVAMFAHINQASADSLHRLGIDIERVAGRKDLKTPAAPTSGERYDPKFRPVAMSNTPRTRRVMRRLQRFAPAQLVL